MEKLKKHKQRKKLELKEHWIKISGKLHNISGRRERVFSVAWKTFSLFSRVKLGVGMVKLKIQFFDILYNFVVIRAAASQKKNLKHEEKKAVRISFAND